MQIKLENIGQRFNYDRIFRGVAIEFKLGDRYAIVGSNGSGKSTLLKLIAGKSIPSEGKIEYTLWSEPVNLDRIYQHISICAPYMSVYEQFTLNELLRFHFQFKNPIDGIELAEIPDLLQLKSHKDRVIENYSSGMKQRVKLGLAVLSKTSILLLDEPFSNLDEKGSDHMSDLIRKYQKDRITIICTNNNKRELSLCDQKLNVEDYKQ